MLASVYSHRVMVKSVSSCCVRGRRVLSNPVTNNYDLNCQRLDAIIDCVIVCGKQNIPFRGHNDADSPEAINKGNFKAILDFRALGDPLLQKHLMEGAKNAQYTSAKIQNEIISLCRSLILEKVGAEVRQNGVYSIICDECTDSANKEQLSLSVRYVARDKICKSFVRFLNSEMV